MGTFLSVRNHHGGALMLNEIGQRLQAPVIIDRQNRDTSTVVVGNHGILALRVNGDKARARAVCRLAIEEGQFSGGAIDRKRAERAANF